MKVGDKIVCINQAKQPHTKEVLDKDVPNWVEQDKVYTLRAIVDYDFVVAYLLDEIHNPPLFFKTINRVTEPAFASWRFRKLEEDEEIVKIKEEIECLS
jgi:hypothetical protein